MANRARIDIGTSNGGLLNVSIESSTKFGSWCFILAQADFMEAVPSCARKSARRHSQHHGLEVRDKGADRTSSVGQAQILERRIPAEGLAGLPLQ